ncbi:phospholipase A2 [Streptomyces sp. NPDC000658]|uniref:phospholipase A2 n=1 Tax=Streptomyces sp. NPDC000658 TaxID=3154266 RepID=UPI00332F4BFD
MNKLRAAAPGIALSSFLLVAGATPALADSGASHTAASPTAAAAVTKAQKLAKLKTLTQNSEASSLAWNAALGDHNAGRASINKYNFNWHTDYCTYSPDSLPGGYVFKWGCYRHDFSYRNYKGLIGNAAFKRDHKLRVDKALLGDLNRVCGQRIWADPYPASQRSRLKAACYKAAKKYYNAVRAAG